MYLVFCAESVTIVDLKSCYNLICLAVSLNSHNCLKVVDK